MLFIRKPNVFALGDPAYLCHAGPGFAYRSSQDSTVF